MAFQAARPKPPSRWIVSPTSIGASSEQTHADGGRDVLRRDVAAGRHVRADRVGDARAVGVLALGALDPAGRDGVHADAARRKLDREIAGQRLERGLAHRNRRVVGHVVPGAGREHAHDRPDAALLHQRDGRLRRLPGAEEVDVHRRVEVLGALLDGGSRSLEAACGVVHEDVEPAPLLDAREEGGDGLTIADVGAKGLRLDACRAAVGGGRLGGLRVARVVDQHVAALGREAERDRAPDPARTAEHHRALAGERRVDRAHGSGWGANGPFAGSTSTPAAHS